MSRALGYCMTLGNQKAWFGFTLLAKTRLSALERAALAFASLSALEPEHAEMAATAAIKSAGAPSPALLGSMDEARFWASCANRSELKACALASFEAMPTTDQTAFLQYITGVASK